MNLNSFKLLRNFLLIICVLFSIVSCGDMKEEISLEKDGSGEYVMYSDMVAGAVKMAEQMATMFQQMDTTGELSSALQNDEMKEMMLERVWQDFPEKVDSTETLYTILTDTSFQTEEQKQIAKKALFFMKGSREEGFINSGIKYGFKDIRDLDKFMEMLNDLSQESEEGPMADMGIGGTEADYFFSKKKFSRTTVPKEKELMSEEDRMMMEMMMGEATIQTVVNTPRKIKEVKGKGIVKQEKKKVVFEYDILELMENPSISDFEIIMK